MTMEYAVPSARRDGIVVEEVGGEVLVYDLRNHRAHVLNASARRIWSHCDGRRSVREVATAVSADLGCPVSDELVELAVRDLSRAELVHGERPALAAISRRQVLRRLGTVAAIAVPTVSSIVAPSAAEASSACANTGEDCTSLPCCGLLICAGSVCV